MRAMDWLGLILGAALGAVAGGAWAQVGHALDFDGTDDWVMVDDPVNVTGPLTLEAWIRCDVADGGRIVSNRFGPNGYEMDVSSSNRLRFTVNGSAEGGCDITAHVGEWTHVAVTWEGPSTGAIVIYVNGEIEDENSRTLPMTDATSHLAVGVAAWGSYFFDGAIDEVRVFDTVLDQETIRVWMTRRIDAGHPQYAHLQAAWSFEENGGQVAVDLVSGLEGRLGDAPEADDGDPAWVASGMVARENATWGEMKALYRR